MRDALILPILRAMDAKLDRIGEEMRDVKAGVSALEHRSALVQRRLDRMDDRLERIEKRLELHDQPV